MFLSPSPSHALTLSLSGLRRSLRSLCCSCATASITHTTVRTHFNTRRHCNCCLHNDARHAGTVRRARHPLPQRTHVAAWCTGQHQGCLNSDAPHCQAQHTHTACGQHNSQRQRCKAPNSRSYAAATTHSRTGKQGTLNARKDKRNNATSLEQKETRGAKLKCAREAQDLTYEATMY